MSRRLLVVEDGSEYADFARVFLADLYEIVSAGSARSAREALEASPCDAMLLDMRFDRLEPAELEGDLTEVASRLFGSDRARALRYLQDEQGALVLAALRKAGHTARAVFVNDMPRRRLENLRRLYGEVLAVPSFDAAAIRAALSGGTP